MVIIVIMLLSMLLKFFEQFFQICELIHFSKESYTIVTRDTGHITCHSRILNIDGKLDSLCLKHFDANRTWIDVG